MKRRNHRLGPSQLGTERRLVSLHYGTPGAGGKAYLQASLHADELPGMLVMHHLMALLDRAEAAGRMRGEIVLVPVANPIGLSQQLLHGGIGRFEAGSGENFNRGYPDFLAAITPGIDEQLGNDASNNRNAIRAALRAHVDAIAPATELASLRKTLSSLACDADVVLDLHCDHDALLHLYCEEPYWPQCEPLARLIGAQTVLLAKNSGGASFDEAMGGVWWQLDEHLHATGSAKRRPIPLACLAVTVELRGQMDVSHGLASRDAQALFDFLAYRGVVLGTGRDIVRDMVRDIVTPDVDHPTFLPALLCEPTPLAASEDLYAPHAGVIVFLKTIGDRIEADEVVAEVIDPIAGLVTPVRARFPGKLYARAQRRYASPGMALAKVAGTTPFRSGNLLSP